MSDETNEVKQSEQTKKGGSVPAFADEKDGEPRVGNVQGAITPPSGPTILELYRVHRDYLNHEHDLINHRLGWNLTIQGLLFAARSVALGKIPDIVLAFSQKPFPQDALLQKSISELRFAAFSITVVGFLTNVAVLFSIVAAIRAMNRIRLHWDHFESIADAAGLPRIFGGGDRTAMTAGFYAPLFLPTTLAFAWLFLLFH